MVRLAPWVEAIVANLMLFIALFISTPSFAASPAAFRGLDGTSRRADVLRVFPQATVEDKCLPDETEQRSAEGSTACKHLVVQSYVLSDAEFELSFLFNLDGTLRYVSILKVLGSPGGSARGVKKSEIETLYWALIEPLSARLGPSVIDAPGSSTRSKYRVGEIEWQPGNGRAWRDGVDRVKLTAQAVERTRWPDTYFGSVHIWYSFVRRGDVSKL